MAIGCPGMSHLPIRSCSPVSFSVLFFHVLSRDFCSWKYWSLMFPRSGPKKNTLSLCFSCIVAALVERTAYIPPTLLHTSQLVSKINSGCIVLSFDLVDGDSHDVIKRIDWLSV